MCVCVCVCVCVCALPRFPTSVLLQDEVLQLVCRAEQEGGRLPVAGDQLTHGRDLRLAELGRSPAPSRAAAAAAPSAQAVVGGGGGVTDVGRGEGLHAEVCWT